MKRAVPAQLIAGALEGNSTLTERPAHLPNFTSPPLDEVVLGVQFSPPANYSGLISKDVWDLFKLQYPTVQELPLLEPSFETFGGQSPGPGVKFHIGAPPVRNRLWFISEDQSHLIQFQEDRFLTNWRKKRVDQEYPRFEKIENSFESCFASLNELFNKTLQSGIDINQAEISYINIIPIDDFSSIGHWIKIGGLGGANIEGFAMQFSEIALDSSNKPYARLHHEIQSVIAVDQKSKAVRLALSFRGKPPGTRVSDALDFFRAGREKIVLRFTDMTTETAHEAWGRVR